MELADPWPAIDRDYFGRIGIEIVGQRVELLLPMRDAVPRVQPIDLGSPVLTGRKPMAGERFRLALSEIGRHGFKRLGYPLMQLLPPRRQQSFVGDVAEERMLEPEAPAGLRNDEPGLQQRGKPLLQLDRRDAGDTQQQRFIEIEPDAGGDLRRRFHRRRYVEAGDNESRKVAGTETASPGGPVSMTALVISSINS